MRTVAVSVSVGPIQNAPITYATAKSYAVVAYEAKLEPYSRPSRVPPARKTTMAHADVARTPAPVTRRATRAIPAQPCSTSCRLASGRPKLPPALMTPQGLAQAPMPGTPSTLQMPRSPTALPPTADRADSLPKPPPARPPTI